MLLPFPQNMQPNHANSSMTVQKAQQLRTWVICNTEPLDCCREHLQRSFLATWNDQVWDVDPPTFDIGVWTLSQQTTESLPKTTNYVDGSQSFFSSKGWVSVILLSADLFQNYKEKYSSWVGVGGNWAVEGVGKCGSVYERLKSRISKFEDSEWLSLLRASVHHIFFWLVIYILISIVYYIFYFFL